jgi:hypothetical protein
MKLSGFLLLISISFSLFSQEEPFKNLERLEIDSVLGVIIKYDSSITEVFNKKLKDLNDSDPFYYNSIEDFSSHDIKAIKTKIDIKSNDEYYIVFSQGPSCDPIFEFYNSIKIKKPNFSIKGIKLYIPGNGYIYVSGHTNNLFDTKKKFEIKANKLVEVEQPFYYVGLKTKTLKPVKLYNSQEFTNEIASLPENYDIEVLMYDYKNKLFIVRTDFGLVGWINIGWIGQKPDLIDGIFYNGD